MTDILIRGMEMPSRCDAKCPMYNTARGFYDCAITKRSYNWGLVGRPSDCPLVKLPPHGDLIDRDAVDTRYSDPEVVETLFDAPVVIPAEEGSE